MSSPADRFRQRAAARQAHAPAPGAGPFSSFFERHEDRRRKSRNRRRILLASVAVHVLVFGFLLLLSSWKVDELYGASVEVRMAAEAAEGDAEADGKPKRAAQINVGRAVGLRLVVSPQGSQLEPRADLEPCSDDLRSRLEAVLRKQLAPALKYPEHAKPLRLRGAVTMLIDVDEASGQANSVQVKEPCLNPVLCTAAKDAVATVQTWPVPALPGPHVLSVSIDYRFN